MKELMRILEKGTKQLSRWIGRLSSIILFCLMVLTFLDVTGRYFIQPIKGTYELTEWGLVLIIFLGLAYTQLEKEHIVVDFIYDKLSEQSKNILDTIIYAIQSLLLFLLSWQVFSYSNRSLTQITSELNLPVSIFIYIAAIGALLYALLNTLELIQAIRKVVSR